MIAYRRCPCQIAGIKKSNPQNLEVCTESNKVRCLIPGCSYPAFELAEPDELEAEEGAGR